MLPSLAALPWEPKVSYYILVNGSFERHLIPSRGVHFHFAFNPYYLVLSTLYLVLTLTRQMHRGRYLFPLYHKMVEPVTGLIRSHDLQYYSG